MLVFATEFPVSPIKTARDFLEAIRTWVLGRAVNVDESIGVAIQVHFLHLSLVTPRRLRKLKIAASVYLWRVDHRHATIDADGKRRCEEIFSAFAQGSPASALRISFPETEQHGPSFPRRSGVVCDYQFPPWHLNLNRPKAARLLVEIGLLVGWTPLDTRRPFVLTNGYEILRAHREVFEGYLNAAESERPA